jgi:hypothetical protein
MPIQGNLSEVGAVGRNNKKRKKIDLMKKSAKIGAIGGAILGILSYHPFYVPNAKFTIFHLLGSKLGKVLYEVTYSYLLIVERAVTTICPFVSCVPLMTILDLLLFVLLGIVFSLFVSLLIFQIKNQKTR